MSAEVEVQDKPTIVTRARGILHEFKPSVISGGAPILPLLLLGGLDAFDGLDLSALAVLLPEIRDYFGVSLTLYLTMSSLTSIIAIAVALPVGFLTDRVNRVWLTVIGAVVFGAMGFFTAFAWSYWVFVAARFGSRIGRVLAPTEQNLLTDYYPPSVRAGIFSFLRMANRVGGFFGPLLAGLLGGLFFWQAPFLVVGIPSVIFAILIATKLKEPARGVQERRLMGASEEVANTEEKPPSWTESWRIARSVRSLRRLWYALPFLVGAGLSARSLLSVYYDEVFGLGPTARGLIGAFDEPIEIVGLVIGAAISNRLLRYRPGRVITYVGLVAVLQAGSFALIALAPFWPLAVGLSYFRGFIGAILGPALLALISMLVPPRIRGFALSTFLVFAVPGLLVEPIFGGIADTFGIRVGLLVMAPVFLIGALIITSAGASAEADIRAATAASMAMHISRESKREGKAKLLVAKDVDVHYDSVQVLFNVDFEVEEGEIVALLGTNGAGKSTLLRAIAGTTPPSNGAIFFDGEDITQLPPSAHAARGIVSVPGGKGVFPTLTVAEHLRVAGWMYRTDPEYIRTATERVLEFFPALRQRVSEPAINLSGGEQQMLVLGQALLSRPRLLMIDELSLGLAPTVISQLLDVVRAIHASGTTVILVEQSVNVALTLSERAVFMEKGEVRFVGGTDELMRRPDILRSVYLRGTSAATGSLTGGRAARQIEAPGGELVPAIEVRWITKTFGGVTALRDVSFELEEGKVLGLIGPNGAGKTTLFDVITGFIPPDGGEVLLFGEDITDLGPDQRARIGLVRSFQDARLFPSLTVQENVSLALERHLEAKNTVAAAFHLPNVTRAEANITRRVDRIIRLMKLGDFRDKFVRELSTGSRRIVDLACLMACDPKVLLLDEPSSGIAQREAEELAPLLQRIHWETGCTILIIEHDMPLISSVSDELMALDLGAIVTRDIPEKVLEHPRVVESYLGTTEEVIRRSGQLV